MGVDLPPFKVAETSCFSDQISTDDHVFVFNITIKADEFRMHIAKVVAHGVPVGLNQPGDRSLQRIEHVKHVGNEFDLIRVDRLFRQLVENPVETP